MQTQQPLLHELAPPRSRPHLALQLCAHEAVLHQHLPPELDGTGLRAREHVAIPLVAGTSPASEAAKHTLNIHGGSNQVALPEPRLSSRVAPKRRLAKETNKRNNQ